MLGDCLGAPGRAAWEQPSHRLGEPRLEGDEVEHEYATEFLDRLIHQVVQTAARSLDLEREPARAESDRVLARIIGRARTERRGNDPIAGLVACGLAHVCSRSACWQGVSSLLTRTG